MGTAVKMKAVGFTAAQLKARGCSIWVLRAAGYTMYLMCKATTLRETNYFSCTDWAPGTDSRPPPEGSSVLGLVGGCMYMSWLSTISEPYQKIVGSATIFCSILLEFCL